MRVEHWPLGNSQRWSERLAQLGVTEVNPVHEGREHGASHLVAIECGGERERLDWSQRQPLEEALSLCLARLVAKRRLPGSFVLR
jgi:hypothetical protein